MGFLGDLASEALSDLTHSQHSSSSAANPPPPPEPSYGYAPDPPGPPPRLFAPWIARWDPAAGRWLYVNEANGERTFEYPGDGYGGYQGGAPGYGGGGYGGGYEERPREVREEESGGGHSGLMYGAMGAAAGAAGGALLMHEGDEIGTLPSLSLSLPSSSLTLHLLNIHMGLPPQIHLTQLTPHAQRKTGTPTKRVWSATSPTCPTRWSAARTTRPSAWARASAT